MGIRRVYRVEVECRLTVEASRVTSCPWGLAGGTDADHTHLDFGDGHSEFFGTIDLVRGQVIDIVTPGGGGFGPPEKRAVASIQRDVAEDRITADFARKVYPQFH